MRRVIMFVLLSPVPLVVACVGGVNDRPTTAVVRDSADVTIVDNGGLPAEPPAQLLGPDLTVGVVDGPPEYQLFRVADVRRLSDGAVAVANGGTRELRIYEADGTHRVTAGGEGRGPTEFSYPRTIAVLPGDTVEVQDRLDRVHFAPDGSFVRRRTADRQALAELAEAVGGATEGGQWTADGSYLAPVYQWDETSHRREGRPFRPEMVLIRASAEFARVDTLGRFGGILQQYVDVGSRGPSATVLPYATTTWWSLAPEDGTIVVGDNAEPQVHRFHPDGSHSVVRWTAEAEPVRGSDVEAWKDRQRRSSWVTGQLPQLEQAWAAVDIPEVKPFYGRATAGSDGTLWLATSDDQGGTTRLTAFGSAGSLVGAVVVPGAFLVFDSGPGWFLGVSRDENDVETVDLYRWSGTR